MKASVSHLEIKWKANRLHGRCPLPAQDSDTNKNLTHQCLNSTGLKPKTEGFILMSQDQKLLTRSYLARI